MNPYIFNSEEPVLINFSGGRSSGYMLKKILEANNGLPKNAHVVFCNTGREMPETLDFVRDCQVNFNVPVIWLEHIFDENGRGTFEEVNYLTASRRGEPFQRIIDNRSILPNVYIRYCSEEMKRNTAKRYMRSIGVRKYTTVLGFRVDEPQRVARMRGFNEKVKNIFSVAPMFDDQVTKMEVGEFWKNNDFDLGLENQNGSAPMGNCDLCFLKGKQKLSSIIRDYPDRAKWWLDIEADFRSRVRDKGAKKENASFIKGVTYEDLGIIATDSIFDVEKACLFCTD